MCLSFINFITVTPNILIGHRQFGFCKVICSILSTRTCFYKIEVIFGAKQPLQNALSVSSLVYMNISAYDMTVKTEPIDPRDTD